MSKHTLLCCRWITAQTQWTITSPCRWSLGSAWSMQPYANSTARQNAYAHHTGTASQPYSYDASATAALHSAPAQYTAGQHAAVPSTASHPPAHPSQAHHSAAQQQDQAPDLSHAPHHSHPPAAAQPANPPPTHPQQHHQSHQHQQQQHQRQHQQSYPQPELDLPSSAGQSHPRWQGSPSPAPGQSGSDQGGMHNQGSLPGEDVGVAAGGRRHVGIKAKSWAGSVVWAKLARYPWWPAQVCACAHMSWFCRQLLQCAGLNRA